MKSTLETLAKLLQDAKTNDHGASLLIGSSTPARGSSANPAKEDNGINYPDSTEIPWSSFIISTCIKNGIFDKVLTYRNSIVSASAVLDFHPFQYDLSSTRLKSPLSLAKQSLFFLDAEETLEEDVLKLLDSEDKTPVIFFSDSPVNKTTLFKYIEQAEIDPLNIFWIQTKDCSQSQEDETMLENAGVTVLEFQDRESFFIQLAKELDLLPLDIISRPFTHMARLLKRIPDFPVQSPIKSLSLMQAPTQWTVSAITQYEDDKLPAEFTSDKVDKPNLKHIKEIQRVQLAFISGDLSSIVQMHEECQTNDNEELNDLFYSAYLCLGDESYSEAKDQSEKDAIETLKMANRHYETALLLKPDDPDHLLLKRGHILTQQSRACSGEEALKHLSKASSIFKKVLENDPHLIEAKVSLGENLIEQSTELNDSSRDSLYKEGIDKLQEVLKENPDHLEAANLIGNVLFTQARKSKGPEAFRLYGQAAEKFQTVLKTQPDNTDALLHMGQSLLIFSKTKKGEEADHMLSLAAENFQKAVRIKPNFPEAFFGWADALLERGLGVDDETGDELCASAMEKFQTVVALKPDTPRVHFRWGVALFNLAHRKSGQESSHLLSQALDKFQAALRQNPNQHEASTRSGHIYLELAKANAGLEAGALLSQAAERYEQSIKAHPQNPEAITHLGQVYFQLSIEKQWVEAEVMLYKAIENYQAALKIKNDYHKALSYWGNALFALSGLKSSEESGLLLAQAEEKYQAALKLKPDDQEALIHYGGILTKKAQQEEGEKTQSLINQATQILTQALEKKDNDPQALSHLGEALMVQARTIKGVNAHSLLAEAKGKLLKAEEIKPGVATYNIARLMAQLANESGCRQWLEKCKSNSCLPTMNQLDHEPELGVVKESKWYKNLWAISDNSLGKEELKEEEKTKSGT